MQSCGIRSGDVFRPSTIGNPMATDIIQTTPIVKKTRLLLCFQFAYCIGLVMAMNLAHEHAMKENRIAWQCARTRICSINNRGYAHALCAQMPPRDWSLTITVFKGQLAAKRTLCQWSAYLSMLMATRFKIDAVLSVTSNAIQKSQTISLNSQSTLT